MNRSFAKAIRIKAGSQEGVEYLFKKSLSFWVFFVTLTAMLAKSIRQQMEIDALNQAVAMSPAKRILIALELSNFILRLFEATNRKRVHERPKKRVKRVFAASKKS